MLRSSPTLRDGRETVLPRKWCPSQRMGQERWAAPWAHSQVASRLPAEGLSCAILSLLDRASSERPLHWIPSTLPIASQDALPVTVFAPCNYNFATRRKRDRDVIRPGVHPRRPALPHRLPCSLVPARMQRRGSASGKVAKWASGRPCVWMLQTLPRRVHAAQRQRQRDTNLHVARISWLMTVS